MTTHIYRRVSAHGRDGFRIERMSLDDVLDDLPMGNGPPFPCRVVWRWRNGSTWMASCRGKDYVSDVFGEPVEKFDSCDKAVAWLRAGEPQPELTGGLG